MGYNWDMLESILDTVLPLHCHLCGAKTGVNTMLCQPCTDELPTLQDVCHYCGLPLDSLSSTVCGECQQSAPAFSAIYTPFQYKVPISHFITELKYQQKLVNARLLSDLLLSYIKQKKTPRPQALIPVPLHPNRIQERGFNQALELARPLAKYWQIPVLVNAVVRHKHTEPQTGLSAQLRQKNLRGAFDINQLEPYQHIAIIDDVVTTGATVRELAAVLATAGIRQIDVYALARAQK